MLVLICKNSVCCWGGAGETAQQLGAGIALTEDLSLILNIRIMQVTTVYNSYSRGSDISGIFGHPNNMALIYTHHMI